LFTSGYIGTHCLPDLLCVLAVESERCYAGLENACISYLFAGTLET